MRPERINAIIADINKIRDIYTPLWVQIAQFLSPESGLFYGETKRDEDKNLSVAQYKRIIDQTPIWALKTTIAGLFNALTPPNKKWFAFDASDDEGYYLAKEIEEFIYGEVLESSGFYKLVPQALRELISFGTFCMRKQYLRETIKFKQFTIGSYAIGQDSFGEIDKVAVQYECQVAEFEEEFGFLADDMKLKQKTDTIQYDGLAIKNYNNDVDDNGLKREWIEYYIYKNQVVRKVSYKTNPFLVARFDLTQSAKGWGLGNGLRGIGAIASLQQLLLDFCNAVEEQFDPSTIINADIFKSGDINFGAGVQNFVSVAGGNLKDFAAVNARTINFNYEGFFAALTEFRKMSEKMLDADIFVTVSGAGKNMTAYEVASLEQEKLLRFGSLFQNITTEFLTPLIQEFVDYFYYKKNIPAQKRPKVNYHGMLVIAQRYEELQKMQNAYAIIGNIGNVKPEIWDNIDVDAIPKEVFRLLGLNTNKLNSADTVVAIRQGRAQAAMAQQQSQQMPMPEVLMSA